jgi:hypothetical protein
VRLLGANLSDNLDCDGGKFKNPGKYALVADRLKAASVFLRNVSAEGEVRLLGADLSGNLECDGGKFKNPDGTALYADGLKAASVFLRNVSAEGEVRLPEADLSGNLECDGGKFKNADGTALYADGLKATAVFLRNDFAAEGEVRLPGANLSAMLDCTGGKFKDPDGTALNADRLKSADVFLTSASAEGKVRLPGANLSGDLDCSGSTFKNPGKRALSADGLKAADVFLRSVSAEGDVRLPEADLSGTLECGGGKFKNPDGTALNAEKLKAAAVFLRNDFAVAGAVDLLEANVKGALYWQDLKKQKGEEAALILSHATVGQLFDDQESWPEQGNLDLDGFVYNRFGSEPRDAPGRLDWLALQQPKNTEQITFKPQPYEQLAKVLREDDDDRGAKSVLIAMEDTRRQYGKLGFWQWCGSWLLRVTIGYGYDTWRGLRLIACFVILGWYLFYLGHSSCLIRQVDDARLVRPFNSFVYSLETFLPLVDLNQAKHWAPDAETRACGRCLRWYLWVHILAGWFFASMLIASITGLVRNG